MHSAVAALLLLLIPPPNDPIITTISPEVGRPTGGEIVRIHGRNFRPHVRVLFALPNEPAPREAFVVHATETMIDVVTPPVLLAPEQQAMANVHVITQAGTTAETRAVAPQAFIYRNEHLTPGIFAIAPSTGAVAGGTRVTIFGEGFQAPVQVLFTSPTGRTAEVRVIDVRFDQIVVEAPPAADLDLITGPVAVTAVNIHSDTRTTLDAGFRYLPSLAITDVSPRLGPKQGGTELRITGVGFTAPVLVTVAGVPARVISLSDTEVRVRTAPLDDGLCVDRTGPVQVTNIENGDSNSGPSFTYVATGCTRAPKRRSSR
jgi:IPT/TIG domain